MTDPKTPVGWQTHDGIAVITINNPPVNATSQAVRAGLKSAVEEANADPAIRAIVIACAGRTFVAGGDIREFGRPPEPPILFQTCDVIEASGKPVVAAIHGTALGGGFEIALASHGRIAMPDTRFGLPEVKLGLVPGAGGSQRLPRLGGLPLALDLATSGRMIEAREALDRGIIDRLASGDLLGEAIAFARKMAGQPPRRTCEIPVPAFDRPEIDKQVEAIERKARGQQSPGEAARLVLAAPDIDVPEGVAREREAFMRLMETDQCKALRHIFFAEREVAKVPGLEGMEATRVSNIGIAGAGTMGSAIAVAAADAGFAVTVVEQDAAAASQGREKIEAIYARNLKSGRIDQSTMDKRLATIQTGHDFAAFAKCDLVIEAVFDEEDIKRALLERLSRVVGEDAIIATNTSYLDPDGLAVAVSHPERFVGMHFFAPANIMRLMEVVRTATTAPQVLATALAVARKMRKLPVVTGVCEGFIGNRIYTKYRQQCEFIVEEGALPHEVDAAMEGLGLPMGPFRVFDLSGLDIAWAMRKRQAATRNPADRYYHVADRLCEMGRFGQKTGAGYYLYKDGVREIDPAVTEMIKAASREKGIARRTFEAREIRERVIAAMVNEGFKTLADGVALRESDIDLVFVNGYGWPAWLGGPMFQGRLMGLDKVVALVREMEQRDGSAFAVAGGLRAAAETC